MAIALKKIEDAPWYIIRPTSLFMSYWDAFTSIALITTALVTPVEVSWRARSLAAAGLRASRRATRRRGMSSLATSHIDLGKPIEHIDMVIGHSSGSSSKVLHFRYTTVSSL